MILKIVENKAEEILNSLNIKNVPVPIKDIAEQMGIQISQAPSKDFSGLLIRKNGRSLMGINSDESEERQRFTMAHELGHYIFHQGKRTFVEYRDNKEGLVRDLKEIHANMFAAAILMPKESLEKDVQKITKDALQEEHVEFLAKKYGVSEKAMNFRLMNLNLPKHGK